MNISKLAWGVLLVSGILVGETLPYHPLSKVIGLAVLLFSFFIFIMYQDEKCNQIKRKRNQ